MRLLHRTPKNSIFCMNSKLIKPSDSLTMSLPSFNFDSWFVGEVVTRRTAIKQPSQMSVINAPVLVLGVLISMPWHSDELTWYFSERLKAMSFEWLFMLIRPVCDYEMIGRLPVRSKVKHINKLSKFPKSSPRRERTERQRMNWGDYLVHCRRNVSCAL